MKGLILALAGFALCTSPASAELSGGVKTGLNIANFTGADAGTGEDAALSKAGLIAGGFMIFPIEKVPFKIQAEFLVSSKGATYKWDVLGSVYETTTKLTYLEIPVLARFEVETKTGANPAFLVGPSFGIKVAAKSESRTVGYSETGDIDNIKALDPGFVLGALLDIETNPGKLSIEARYTRSFATIVENTGGTDVDIRNSVLSFLIGYRF